MITMSAKISLIDSTYGTLSSVYINNTGNNISSEIGAIMGVRARGSNPLLFGSTKFSSRGRLLSKVLYYIGNVKADENGSFESPYMITLNGSNITSFTICFDDYNDQFPTRIDIDGTAYSNINPVFTVTDLTSADSHIITIDNWNTPNYPLRIQGIYVNIDIDINTRNVSEMDISFFDRSDIEKPCWGIKAGTGNIKFIDSNNSIRYYAEQNLLKSNQKVTFEVKNTLITGQNETVGVFATSKWNYNNANKVVNVELKDDLLDWQDILVPYMPYNKTSMTMFAVYEYLKSITPSKWTFVLKDNAESILKNTICKYPYIENGSLWNQWEKLCEVCALYIYKDKTGNVIIDCEFRS